MKNELFTAIVAAIAGVVISYFVCNMIVGSSPSDFSFPTISTTSNNKLTESNPEILSSPNEEVFNYKALNPTVEVYVGDCTEINIYGECVDESSGEIDQNAIDGTEDTNNSDNTNNSNSQTQPNQRNK